MLDLPCHSTRPATSLFMTTVLSKRQPHRRRADETFDAKPSVQGAQGVSEKSPTQK
jgi:hypothetical protein